MAQPSLAGIVLAAGLGTRMKSDSPKCLHAVCGVPMAALALRALAAAGVERPVVVVGFGAERLRAALGDGPTYAVQERQRGTGDAAACAAVALAGFEGTVLIVPGDAPLVRAESLRSLAEARAAAGAAAALATVELPDPTGYGRVVRGEGDEVEKIVEERDADEATKRIREVCVSVYAFEAKKLFAALPRLSDANAQGELYLTDVIEVLARDGERVLAVPMADPEEFRGVNDRWQLALAERALRLRILRGHAEAGVTIREPETTFVGPDVELGRDCVLESGAQIGGRSKLGARCRVGPFSSLEDVEAGDDCVLLLSHLRRCRLGAGVKVGPYANIRPHATLGDRCKVGNFVEVKNAELAEDVSASHLSYLGDASIGAGTNVGAGTITCNFDGFAKHRTTVGAGAFLGSHSTLVAPITIGDGAMVAAGSVVTVDVPADAAAFGRSRTEVKAEWARRWRERRHKR